MGQDLKEFFFPEDYGYVVNVDQKSKEEIGMAIHSAKIARREIIKTVNDKLMELESQLGNLYALKIEPNLKENNEEHF